MTHTAKRGSKYIIKNLVAFGLLSSEEKARVIAKFSDNEPPNSEELDIVGMEMLGRYLSKEKNKADIIAFLQQHRESLANYPDDGYFFVASLVKNYCAMEEDIIDVVAVAPEGFQPYLKQHFLIPG